MNNGAIWSEEFSKWAFPKQIWVPAAMNTDLLQSDWYINPDYFMNFEICVCISFR